MWATDAYAEKLSIVPPVYHAKLHVLLQRGMLILQMSEVHRGNENIEATSFKIFDDSTFNFKYIQSSTSLFQAEDVPILDDLSNVTKFKISDEVEAVDCGVYQ